MGINTGFCNVGNFGSDQRLTYTIIGGEVNVAQRLEAAADADGILMSYETYAFTQDLVDVEQKDTIPMKGINREIKIFSVLGRRERGTGEKLTGHQKHEQSRSNIKHNELDRDMSDRVNNLESKVHVLTEHLKKTSKKVDDILALMER